MSYAKKILTAITLILLTTSPALSQGYTLAELHEKGITSYCRILMTPQGKDEKLGPNPDLLYYRTGCCTDRCTSIVVK